MHEQSQLLPIPHSTFLIPHSAFLMPLHGEPS